MRKALQSISLPRLRKGDVPSTNASEAHDAAGAVPATAGAKRFGTGGAPASFVPLQKTPNSPRLNEARLPRNELTTTYEHQQPEFDDYDDEIEDDYSRATSYDDASTDYETERTGYGTELSGYDDYTDHTYSSSSGYDGATRSSRTYGDDDEYTYDDEYDDDAFYTERSYTASRSTAPSRRVAPVAASDYSRSLASTQRGVDEYEDEFDAYEDEYDRRSGAPDDDAWSEETIRTREEEGPGAPTPALAARETASAPVASGAVPRTSQLLRGLRGRQAEPAYEAPVNARRNFFSRFGWRRDAGTPPIPPQPEHAHEMRQSAEYALMGTGSNAETEPVGDRQVESPAMRVARLAREVRGLPVESSLSPPQPEVKLPAATAEPVVREVPPLRSAPVRANAEAMPSAPASVSTQTERNSSGYDDTQTSQLSNHMLLRSEARSAIPQLVDPFAEGQALGRFSHDAPRPASIEPSVFDADAVSAQPSSPMLPRSGPLSADRPSLDSSGASDFYSTRSARNFDRSTTKRQPLEARAAPALGPSQALSKQDASGAHKVRRRQRPPVFRGLEHRSAHGHGRRPPLPREPQNYLLTPSVAPTETETDDAEEMHEPLPGGKRSWLLHDLTPEQVHYLLREMVSKELNWELDRAFTLTGFDRPAARRQHDALFDGESYGRDLEIDSDVPSTDDGDDEEAVFRRDVYDQPCRIDLPVLRFLLRNALCTFPLFVPPERPKDGRPVPNKAAIARTYFFSAIMPIVREVQARSLSAAVDRHGEGDGMPFMAQSALRSFSLLIHKWAVRYVTNVLRVGPGNPFYGIEQVHNRGWPWPSADLLPPEAYVCYRKPTDRLRFGGFEVDVVAVRVHAHNDRDFLLRVRRPNRMDEFVVRNDADWEEFRAKLAEELGPYVHVRPLPRMSGREAPRGQSSTQDASYSSESMQSQTDETSEYDDESTFTSEVSSGPPPGMSAEAILRPLYAQRDRPLPPFELDRRLLRSWLRDTLAIRSVADSSEVRAFLSIGCFGDRELDTHELLSIAERRRIDCRRIEEREKDAEMAGENVLGIRRVQQRIWRDCVDGDGFLKVYDALRTTPVFEDLPTSYQTMFSWGNLHMARFLYGIFIQGDESRANLMRARDLVDLIPWRKLANAMRLSPLQVVAEWQKQFLRNRFLQTLFQIMYDDDPMAMDEELRALQMAIGSDTMVRKIRTYVDNPEDVKRLVRQHAERADIPLVAAIVRGADAPKLTKAEIQRVILATRAHAEVQRACPNAAQKKACTDEGYLLIVRLQHVLRIYSQHRDATQIRGMLQDPTVLDALTLLFQPFLDALVRLHRVKDVRRDLLDLHAFLLRLLDLLEGIRARMQDPARSINMVASFLDRGTPALYDFLHRWAQVDPVVFSTFAWLRHLAMTVGTGSEDLATLWDLPVGATETTGVDAVATELQATTLEQHSHHADGSSAPPADEMRLSEELRAEIHSLASAARCKRGRQMEIACRWAAGDTEADFSVQVLGDGEGRMRREPFLPKEPRPAPKTLGLYSLLRSFREAASDALAP